MAHSHSPIPTGFWVFSMHLPSKVEIWQVSVCSLQAPPLTGFTPASQCHLHKLLSLLPHLDPTQFLTHSSSKSLPLPCHPPGTHFPCQNVTFEDQMHSSSSRMPLLSLIPRSDPFLLYQGPHLEWDGEAGEHISLSTQGSLFFCLIEMRPFALWFLEKKEEEINGQSSLSKDSKEP